MKAFMDQDFLLKTDTAKHLFHDVAKDLPIYDYHCHLIPAEIYEDRTYDNLTQLWLGGDHYKWRAMRLCGVEEKYITGDASDREKFHAFASIMPLLIGNPLYHWAHLELQRYFDIHTPLCEKTADMIYNNVAEQLKSGRFSARKFIEMSNVAVVCTTDDPTDTLEYHIKLREEGFSTRVLPTFRPDKALNIRQDGFADYIALLGKDIADVDALLAALYERADFFASVGCKISDHAFTTVPFVPAHLTTVNEIFAKRLRGEAVTDEEADAYTTYVFLRLCEKYYDLGWAVQIHIGAMRNNNTAMFERLGPDTGYDSVYASNYAEQLSRLLDSLAKENKLPKTILYTLNPSDNYVLAAMLGNFAADVRGKMQFGSAWWFCDHIEGMTRHFRELASIGAAGPFIGMLTDSRSLLSYPRHEYFRRIICDIIGGWVEEGQFPNDDETLTKLIRGICCDNIIEYLGF